MMVREVLEPYEQENDEDDDSEYDLDFLINEMNLEKIDQHDWFNVNKFLDSEDFDCDLFGLDNVDDDDFENKLTLFSQNFPVDSFLATDKRSMPASNLALENLNLLSRIVLDVRTFKDAVLKFKKNSDLTTGGLLGILLSFFCNRCCLDVPYDDSQDFLALEEESITLSEQTIKMEFGEDTESIEAAINHLEDIMKTAPPKLIGKYKLILKRYKAMKTVLQETPIRDGDLESISQKDFCLKIKSVLLDEKKVPRSYRLIPIEILVENIRAELDLCLDDKLSRKELNQYQHSTYRESIRKPYITSLFLDTFSWAYDIGISLKGYETEGQMKFDWDSV